MRRICMVPSNTLSSSDASKVASKIIEGPIFVDYLSETNHVTSKIAATLHVNDQDWWDIGPQDYVRVLVSRHGRRVSEARLRADRNLHRPDISTFKGPTVLRLRDGTVKAPPLVPGRKGGDRSEFYEIKPDNRNGERDARQKLVDLESDYLRHNLAGIYRRGSVYPSASPRTIHFTTDFLDLWHYLVNLQLSFFGVSVFDIEIVVRRSELGVLLYKICVTLDGADSMQKDSCYMMANYAVRMLLKVRSIGATAEENKAAAAVAASLEPADRDIRPDRSPVIAGRDLSKTPYLRLAGQPVADEIRGLLPAIRDAMYSRLMGKPGEVYYICCDNAYYQNMIRGPLVARMRSVKDMLGTGGTIRGLAGVSMMTLLPGVTLTGRELVENLPSLGADAARWVVANPKETVIIVSVAVAVTAAVILTCGTVALPAAAAAGGGVAAAEGTVAGLVVADAAGLASGAEAAVGMTTGLMAETAGAGTAAAAAVPEAVVTTGSTAGTTVSSASTLIRTVLANAPTAQELSAAAAQQRIDALLIEAMTAAKPLMPKVVAGGVSAVTLIGISSSTAYAATPPTSPQQTASPPVVGTSLGRLYVVKVPTQLPYPLLVPGLLKEFDVDKYKDQSVQLTGGNQPATGKLVMLGAIQVV